MLQYIKRKTNNNTFIPEIDGLRFFAIATVLIFHLNTSFSRAAKADWKLILGFAEPTQAGWWLVRLDLGVKVFFAISGFILAIPFLKYYLTGGKKIELGDYFYRRLTRLEPPFLVSLVAFYLLQVTVLHLNASDLIPNFLASLIYIHTLVFGVPSLINPVTWSLETEAQFYILIPFIIAFLFWFKKRWLTMLFIAVFIGLSVYLKYYISVNKISNLNFSILGYLSNFLIGLIFGWLYLKKKEWVEKKSYLWDVIGLLSVFVLFLFYKPQAEYLNNIVFNTAIFTLFISVFKGPLTNWFYTRPIIYVIGGMCYTIYLLHYAFFEMVVKLFPPLQFGRGYLFDLGVHFLIYVPILFIVCCVFFVLIEKPCMNKEWPKQLMAWIKGKKQTKKALS